MGGRTGRDRPPQHLARAVECLNVSVNLCEKLFGRRTTQKTPYNCKPYDTRNYRDRDSNL